MEKLPSIIHASWHPYLQNLFNNDFPLQLLKNKILPTCKFYPEPQNIFRVFSMPINDIKVVILGQDPYSHQGQAIGYAFAVAKGIRKPASLKIIEKELGHELDETLESWINQGVFLLNTALTVEEKKPYSHLQYWRSFIVSVIRIIESSVSPIWMLWGASAKEFSIIIETTAHYGSLKTILTAPHPAAEAYIGGKTRFYGCNHFKIANEILAKTNSTINF
jgi:uracil-DNA glycosylase